MNRHPRHKSNLWTALLLLMALLSAQPILAEHVHFVDPSHELCDLSFHQLSTAAGNEYRVALPLAVTGYLRQSAPVPGDSQPERQTARGPPALLSH
ncbi:hypothetical protein [Microbulbifer yueqingensis]|uniref:Uncharacterized protein n=1 Tax=Microbulbifer yueqingensis TaxID=658219 RepID=A0A1G9DGD7_9GAMM|nr:hypothetical protein [Microbulbifer yueqingensis]SDK62925.1 hypothetical protein SAMN05216212_2795 [Microbulbifer yueqingensis]